MRIPVLLLSSMASVALFGADTTDGQFERTLNVPAPVTLDIRNDSGRITVRGGGSQVVIRATMRAHRNLTGREDALARIRAIEANPPIEQNGGTIRVGHFHDQHADRGVSITYEISVPTSTRLHSINDSGGHDVSDIEGPVDVTSDSGGVDIARIRSEVRVKVDSGGVRITDVDGPVFANADSGGIRAMNVGGSLDLSTDSGGIHFSQTRPAPIKAHADSGGITARLAPNAGYELQLDSDSGNVTADAPITVSGGLSRNKVRGRIGGGGPLVVLQTDSGNVRLQ